MIVKDQVVFDDNVFTGKSLDGGNRADRNTANIVKDMVSLNMRKGHFSTPDSNMISMDIVSLNHRCRKSSGAHSYNTVIMYV